LTSEEADPGSQASTAVGFLSAFSSRIPTPDGAAALGPFEDQNERLRDDINWLKTLMLAYETTAPGPAIRETLYCYGWTKERVDQAIMGYVEQRRIFIDERDRAMGERFGGRPKRDRSGDSSGGDIGRVETSADGNIGFPSLGFQFLPLGSNWFRQ